MTPVTEAQAHLDEEITKYMMTVCALRTQRNTFSLIGRLPAETLADVFIHHAGYYYGRYNGRATSKPPPWVKILHVCRHWRDVALNCPKLWSYLFITSPYWIKTLLARSKQASLKVHVTSRFAGSREFYFMKGVMIHVERIQEIHLDLDMADDVKFLRQLSSRAPRLRNLKIEISGVSRRSMWPSVLFDGDTPALRTLELKSCPIPWYSFRLSGLTTLSLKDVPDRLQQNMGEFLATLRIMQNLAHLYLDHALSGVVDSLASHNLQKISLPYLSRLLIVAPLWTVTTLLSCIDFPLETELRLECTESPLHDSSLDDLFPGDDDQPPSLDEYVVLSSLLAQRFTTSADPALSGAVTRSLVVDCPTYSCGTRLTFSALEHDYNSFKLISEEWGFSIPLRITLHLGRSTVDDRLRITGDICCAVLLKYVQCFHVIAPSTSPDFWRKMTRHLPNLRNIKLSHGGMPDLASVLSVSNLTASDDMESHDGNADRGSGGILVPALEELELENIFFSCASNGFMNWHATDAQSLCDALSTRKYIQGQITMTRCCLYNDWDTRFDLVGRWEGGRFRIITVEVQEDRSSIF